MPAIGSVNVKISATTAGLTKGLSSASSSLATFGSAVTRVASQVATATVAITGIGKAFSLLTSGISNAADMEQAEISFGVLFKSAETAKAVLGDVSKFAAETPFELPELITGSRSLAAFKVAAEDIVPTMRRLGDVSAGIGVPVAELAQLYGRAKVQGRLFGEDINELTGRGIPIISELAKQFGVADDKVKELVSQGKIGFPQLEQAFVSMTSEGGQFAGLMAAQSRSYSGIWSNLKDNVSATFRDISGAVLQAFDVKTVLGNFISFTGQVKDSVMSIIPIVEQFANTATALWTLLATNVSSVFDYLVTSSGATFTGIKDFIVDALIIGEFVFQNFAEVASHAWDRIKLGGISTFNDIGHFFTTVIPAWIAWFGKNWGDVFYTAFDYASTVFINLGTNLRNMFSSLWKWIKSGFTDAFEIDWKPLTEGAVNSLKSLPDIPQRAITELESKLGEKIAKTGESLGTRLGEHMVKRQEEIAASAAERAKPIPTLDASTLPGAMPPGVGGGGKKITELGSFSAANRNSTEAISAVIKQMRGGTTQDKLLTAAEKQASDTEAIKKLAQKEAQLPRIQIVAGDV